MNQRIPSLNNYINIDATLEEAVLRISKNYKIIKGIDLPLIFQFTPLPMILPYYFSADETSFEKMEKKINVEYYNCGGCEEFDISREIGAKITDENGSDISKDKLVDHLNITREKVISQMELAAVSRGKEIQWDWDKDITEIYGVGEKLSKKLIEKGYSSIESLAKATTSDLEPIVGGSKRAHNIIGQAQKLYPGISVNVLSTFSEFDFNVPYSFTNGLLEIESLRYNYNYGEKPDEPIDEKPIIVAVYGPHIDTTKRATFADHGKTYFIKRCIERLAKKGLKADYIDSFERPAEIINTPVKNLDYLFLHMTSETADISEGNILSNKLLERNVDANVLIYNPNHMRSSIHGFSNKFDYVVLNPSSVKKPRE